MKKKDILKEAKLHSGAVYGNTVLTLAEHLDACKHCRHFDEEEFKCNKIHHCSPESYV